MPIKLEIILNPAADKGAAAEKSEEIRTKLEKLSVDHRIHLTEKPGHAKKLAEDLSGDSEVAVIAAGGDGTANEVINGLMERWEEKGGPYPIFGIIPIGRGNDMAYGAGIPDDWESALEKIAERKTVPMDIGRLRGGDYPEGLWFGNGVGIGFDAIVGFEAARMKRVHGAASYTLGALKTLALYPRAPKVQFTADGYSEIVHPALISIMNGRRMGGSFFMAPDATTEDGRLNWCRTVQGPRLRLLSAMIAYTKGSQTGRRDTETGEASGLSIRALEGTLAVHADGETVCEAGKNLDIAVAPGALRLIGRSVIHGAEAISATPLR